MSFPRRSGQFLSWKMRSNVRIISAISTTFILLNPRISTHGRAEEPVATFTLSMAACVVVFNFVYM